MVGSERPFLELRGGTLKLHLGSYGIALDGRADYPPSIQIPGFSSLFLWISLPSVQRALHPDDSTHSSHDTAMYNPGRRDRVI